MVEGGLLTDVGGTLPRKVLSTPGMIAMMEYDSTRSVRSTSPDTRHGRLRGLHQARRRAPEGALLHRERAPTRRRDERKLCFDVEVREGDRTIGVGTHQRRAQVLSAVSPSRGGSRPRRAQRAGSASGAAVSSARTLASEKSGGAPNAWSRRSERAEPADRPAAAARAATARSADGGRRCRTAPCSQPLHVRAGGAEVVAGSGEVGERAQDAAGRAPEAARARPGAHSAYGSSARKSPL